MGAPTPSSPTPTPSWGPHEAELTAAGLRVRSIVRVSLMGDEAEFVADAARETGAELIVMGSRGRTAIAGAVLGSTSQRILHEAPCPVWMHARAYQAAGRRRHAGRLMYPAGRAGPTGSAYQPASSPQPRSMKAAGRRSRRVRSCLLR